MACIHARRNPFWIMSPSVLSLACKWLSLLIVCGLSSWTAFCCSLMTLFCFRLWFSWFLLATIPRGGLERGAARVWDVLDFYVCKGKSLSLKIGHLSGQGHSPLGLSDLGPILSFFWLLIHIRRFLQKVIAPTLLLSLPLPLCVSKNLLWAAYVAVS